MRKIVFAVFVFVINICSAVSFAGSISGLAWKDMNGDGIRNTGEALYSNVPVRLYQLLATSTLVGSTTTDANGAYSFNGLDVQCNNETRCRYSVYFDNPDAINYQFTLQDVGSDDAVDSDVVKRDWGDLASTVAILDTDTLNAQDIDAGFASLGSISGLAWKDMNGDGIRNTGEALYSNVPVRLYQLLATSTLVGSTTTDANGAYSFNGLDVQCNNETRCRYSVYFDNPDAIDYQFTLQDVGSDDAVDSDVVKRDWGDLASVLVTLDEDNLIKEYIDAGFANNHSVSGLAWKDLNANGIQESSEPIYSGVPVRIYQLLTASTLLIDDAITDNNGQYQFVNLQTQCNQESSCRYSVYFDNHDASNYGFTLQDVGNNDLVDSDVVKRSWGDLASALITLSESVPSFENINAGFSPLNVSSELDDDSDGVINLSDLCPETSVGISVNADGCSQDQIDSDGDGVADYLDAFPGDVNEQSDLDGDGVGDNADLDRDGDGILNVDDADPNVPNSTNTETETNIHLYEVRTVVSVNQCKRVVGDFRDSENNAVNLSSSRSVSFYGDNIEVSTSSDCTNPVNSIVIDSGQAQFVFYIKTNKRGNLSLVLETTGLLNTELTIQSLDSMNYTGIAYYVSTTGLDTNDGSMFSPFATVSHAATQVDAGDAIFIYEGVYTSNELNPIVIRKPDVLIRNVPGNKVKLIQTSSSHNIWFYQAINAQKVTGGRVHGLELEGGFYAIKVDGSDFVISNNEIHDTRADGIKLTYNRSATNNWNGDNTVILGNEIYRTQTAGINGQGVDAVNADNLLIENNYIHDINDAGVLCKGGSVDCVIRKNYIVRTSVGISFGVTTASDFWDDEINPENYENINGLIYNNIVENVSLAAVRIQASLNSRIINNSFVNVKGVGVLFETGLYYRPDLGFFAPYQVKKNKNMYIANNVIQMAVQRGQMQLRDMSFELNVAEWGMHTYNNIHDNPNHNPFIWDRTDTSQNVKTHFLPDDWQALPVNASDIVAIPNLSLGKFYQPDSSSPVISAGIRIDEFIDDYVGNLRDAATPFVGAHENIASVGLNDADGDGVDDVFDRCSGTDATEVVDADGC